MLEYKNKFVNSQGNTKLFVVIGLVTLVLVGGIAFYLMSGKSNAPEASIENVAENSESKTNTEKATETKKEEPAEAPWKKYENTKNKYSFEHPATWTIKKESDKITQFTISGSKEFVAGILPKNSGFNPACIDTVKEYPITVNGKEAKYKQVKGSDQNGCKNSRPNERLFVFVTTGTTYDYLASQMFEASEEKEAQVVYEKVLKTFKYE